MVTDRHRVTCITHWRRLSQIRRSLNHMTCCWLHNSNHSSFSPRGQRFSISFSVSYNWRSSIFVNEMLGTIREFCEIIVDRKGISVSSRTRMPRAMAWEPLIWYMSEKWITTCVEQTPHWEANSHSACQEFYSLVFINIPHKRPTKLFFLGECFKESQIALDADAL